MLGRLEHPNIVPIHDMGTDADGQLFYTMKLVKGRTLQHILRDLRLEHPDTLRDHHLPALLTEPAMQLEGKREDLNEAAPPPWNFQH